MVKLEISNRNGYLYYLKDEIDNTLIENNQLIEVGKEKWYHKFLNHIKSIFKK